ncbi:MAG: hypothetical protein IPL61_12140 [Myxococcales bacterium]|nr:hypothetical protein [Myxococcales bacterium]
MVRRADLDRHHRGPLRDPRQHSLPAHRRPCPQGLYRAYQEERDELQVVRGRVLARESLARAARGAVAVVCEYETLTDNLADNQILLWTLERLRRVALGREDVRRMVRDQYRTLAATLDLVPFRAEDCTGRSYHQLNHDYQAIHALCRLLLTLCGAATASGPTASIPFTVDMPRLVRALRRPLARRRAPRLGPIRSTASTSAPALCYPVDIVVRDPATRRPIAVIDTKYKDDDRPAAADVQQVVFYATVIGCHEAWLVYPRPVRPLSFAAGPVRVRTFGLDLARVRDLDPTSLGAAIATAVA